MEEKKDPPAAGTPGPAVTQSAAPGPGAEAQATPGAEVPKPEADALGKPTDEAAVAAAATAEAAVHPPKKVGGIKNLLKKFNIYLLLFVFIVVLAGVVMAVGVLNGKKTPKPATVASQELSQSALSQLNNSDTTVGGNGQTLTVQGNAVFSGQVLIRSDLSVAGTIKVGTAMSVPQITVTGKANLGDTQVSSLQVAQNTILQGSLTAQKDINIAGAASFSGPVTASQITVTKLIMSGNASLQIPNHIAFTGASPNKAAGVAAPLGSGGTASINGSDTTGTVSIGTGNNTAAGCFISLTFVVPFTSAPHVLVSPIGAGAGLTQWYVTRTTTGFSICTNNAPPTGASFGFDYFVTQ